MSILLDRKEILAALNELHPHFQDVVYHSDKRIVEAMGKKILIELQKIYNLPDEGMFHKKLGEFIQGLMEEVK